MLKKCVYRSSVLALLLSFLPFSQAAFGVPLCVDGVNSQYFQYNGEAIALVGASASYLCHVPVSNHVGDYCTYEAPGTPGAVGYKDYIDDLAAKGLNTFRLWVTLNHSPGIQPGPGIGQPYADEQPFFWNEDPMSANYHKWDVGLWNEAFFDHIREVITYAQSKTPPVFVEVTLFDPWSGDWDNGPWNNNNIYNGTAFAAEKGFVTLPSGGTCAAFGGGPRKRQIDLMKKLAAEINSLDNFYWEIANEPDINAGDGVTGLEAAAWHNCVIQELYNYEGTLPNGRHMIGVNYHTADSLNSVSSAPKIKVVNGHYVDLADSTRFSAIELIRGWHEGPNGSLGRIFGFNESKITPIQTSAEATRAEAWEFMLNEGGVYDHLGYEWSTSAVAANTRTYLGKLNTFLKGLNLRRAKRSTGNPPAWAPSLPAYESPEAAGSATKIYWAAMQEGTYRYVLYIHHSTKQTSGGFRGYVKPASITRLNTLTVQLGSSGDTYTVEWLDPATGALKSSTTVVADGLTKTLTVPNYTYDIVLRMKGGITNVVAAGCAAN